MKKSQIREENQILKQENASLKAKAERAINLYKKFSATNRELHDRVAELLEESIKDPTEREVAQLRLAKDKAGKITGFTIHAVNEEDIGVINNIRNRIFFGGNPNVEYDGRVESSKTHAGTLKFAFKNSDSF